MQIKGDHRGLEGLRLQALNHGVIPVDFVEQVFDLGQRRRWLVAPAVVVGATAALGVGAKFVLRLVAHARIQGGKAVVAIATEIVPAFFTVGSGVQARAGVCAAVVVCVSRVLRSTHELISVAFVLVAAPWACTLILDQGVLAPVINRVNQGLSVWDEVADPHAWLEGVAQGLRDRAAQGHRIVKFAAQLEQGDHIAVAQGALQAIGVHGFFFNGAWRLVAHARLQSLNHHLVGIGHGAGAARVGQQTAQSFTPRGQLKNGWVVQRAQQGHPRSGGRNQDHVAGQQALVCAGVALGDELVQVQAGHGFVVPDELNIAQTASGGGTAAFKQGADQGGQAGQGVCARFARLAHHKNRQAAQLPQ